jgi:[acyl-carrier-protein] S-malonyltransferase
MVWSQTIGRVITPFRHGRKLEEGPEKGPFLSGIAAFHENVQRLCCGRFGLGKNIAFLFPGQGSQAVGMGLDLYEEYDFVREIFDMVDETTKSHISKLCFKGPMEDLTLTVNLQPAVTAVNLACLAVLQKEGVHPAVSAGHSLGEYSALRAANVTSTEATLKLVFKRGQLMHREATKNQGAMHAILGLDIGTVGDIVEKAKAKGIVAVANHNAAQQIVITGAPEAVEYASELASAQGAKAIPLKVSGAWHSELIRGAEEDFKTFLASIPFQAPETPVVFNVTAEFESDLNQIRQLMATQLCSPVRWYDSMCKMQEQGVEVFAEVGPKRVLTGLLRKIIPENYEHQAFNVDSMKGLETFLKAVT